jgi:hypothetical protein
MTRVMGRKTSDEPKSGCLRIRPSGRSVSIRALRKTPGERSSEEGRARKLAMAKRKVSLANSLGWNWIGPRSNHRRAPLREVPRIWTATSRAMDTQ